jgi:hypothetical protein
MKFVSDFLTSLQSSGTEKTPPDPSRTKMAFARVGYALPQAIADLIDNSIDAEAKTVLIRFLYDRKGVHRVFIVDDGKGMSEPVLSQAMRFGSTLPHRPEDLGQYGIGLKAASFSQCNTLSVITNSGKEIAGRRWTNESIGRDWLCEKLAAPGCKELLSAPWAELALQQHGTIVMWEELTGLQSGQSSPVETVNRAIEELAVHLGMVFHRFLSRNSIKIVIDTQFVGRRESTVPHFVEALNPFSYPKSGAQAYPKAFQISLEGIGTVILEAHIWPARTQEPGYRLGGGKVASRQGFYFYRNSRLIQAGGWNGYRDQDDEPHLSLARVSVNLPKGVDVSIQKDKVDNLPKGFIEEVRQAATGSIRFTDFIKKAQEVYRSRGRPSEDDFPLVPRKGLSGDLRDAARKLLGENERRVRAVDFRWSAIEAGKVFEIDRDKQRIVLNELYRKSILYGRRRSENDAQLFKVMLFLLTHEYFDFQAMTKARAHFLEICNQLLLRSLND